MDDGDDSLSLNPRAYLVIRKAIEDLPLQLWSEDALGKRMDLLEELSAMAGKITSKTLPEGIEVQERLRKLLNSRSEE